MNSWAQNGHQQPYAQHMAQGQMWNQAMTARPPVPSRFTNQPASSANSQVRPQRYNSPAPGVRTSPSPRPCPAQVRPQRYISPSPGIPRATPSQNFRRSISPAPPPRGVSIQQQRQLSPTPTRGRQPAPPATQGTHETHQAHQLQLMHYKNQVQGLKHAIQTHANSMGVEVSSIMDSCVTESNSSSDNLLLQVLTIPSSGFFGLRKRSISCIRLYILDYKNAPQEKAG